MILHSQIIGEPSANKDLFILHGLYGSSSNWRSLGLKYASDRKVHLIDLRNHGRSPWHEEHNYLELASDISRYADHHQIKAFDLLGHSMGGKTAMALALEQPEYLDKLIVADIAPIRYIDNEHNDYIEAMRLTIEQNPKSRQEADELLAKYIQSTPIRQFFLQNFILEENEQGITIARWRIHLDALSQNLSHILDFPIDAMQYKAFHKPTLFVHGGQSQYIEKQHHEIIQAHFPYSEIKTIENASHWLHAQAPETFLSITQNFLNQ